MIRHIVMFKLTDEFDGKSAYENALIARDKALKLKEFIPEILKLDVVVNSKEAPQSNFDIALICDFESIKTLDIYQVHPKHKEFGKYITELREDRACIDFEI